MSKIKWFLTSKRLIAVALLIVMLPAFSFSIGQSVKKARVKIVRMKIGIVAYDEFEKEYNEYKKIFTEIFNSGQEDDGTLVLFALAVGSYSDVLDWYNKGLIDVAIATPGPAAKIIKEAKDKNRSDIYLATQYFPPVPDYSMLALEDRKNGKVRLDYRSVCLVRKDTGIRNFDALKKRYDNQNASNRVVFYFVDPLSASGFLLPAYALNRKDIRIARDSENIKWTYGTFNSVKRLFETPPEGEIRVACIGDYVELGKDVNQRALDELEIIDIPDVEIGKSLNDITIPQSTALLNYHLPDEKFKEYKQIIEKFVESTANVPDADFQDDPAWRNKFADVYAWVKMDEDKGHPDHSSDSALTLDGLIQDLNTYRLAGVGPIRLAVVLSGGGAKCAYQIGALGEIEDKLRLNRERNKEKPIDIDLVVGTSGGAINALTVALGITKNQAQRAELLKTWKGFRQASFFKPSTEMKFSFGLVFGLLWVFVIVRFSNFVILRFPSLFGHRPKWKTVGFFIIFIGLLQIAISLPLLDPTTYSPYLGSSHVFLHAWFVLITLICSWTAPWLLVAGVLTWIWGAKSEWLVAQFDRIITRETREKIRQRYLTYTLCKFVVVILGFGAVAYLLSLPFTNPSLSSSTGIEESLAKTLPGLFKKAGIAVDPSPKMLVGDKLKVMSRALVDQESFKRDLVITVSRLQPDETKNQSTGSDEKSEKLSVLPNDLYFYYSSKEKTRSTEPGDKRFISFRDNKEHVLDVVIGSSTIFPIFPHKEISNIKTSGSSSREDMKIIDGGFIHNSPIEAAVAWGATHIILIEASADVLPSYATFPANVSSAFNFLFYQAQQVDTKLKGKNVEIYELQPSCRDIKNCKDDLAFNKAASDYLGGVNYDLDTFDFEPDLVDFFSRKGRYAAASKYPRFKRIGGEPKFREVPEQ